LRDQKEVIFRLYFVDTPEEERVYADRIVEQAAYFGITPDVAIQIGREASEFTKRALTKPFTIQTRWRPALGRSAIWRYYAIIVTADGHDLNELLVSAGLARIYGIRTPLPDGRDSRTSAGTGNTSQSRTARRMGKIAAVKYWEIIADNLSKAGWSWAAS
jgi:endonuclease YncB( thermonuclease family)